MSQNKGFSYTFRKYPLFRAFLAFLFIVLAITAAAIILHQTKKIPVINGLNPSVSESGELVTISGQNFGTMRSDSFVELGGNRLVSSAYSTWTDEQIQFIVPYNTNDGLLYVITPDGRSNPVVFTCRTTIPVPVKPDAETLLPSIASLNLNQAAVGTVVTISGKNFGSLRNSSKVLFSAAAGKAKDTAFITCSESDSDYLFWSDQEIQVRVPDGAETGYVWLETGKGQSNRLPFTVTTTQGNKNYKDERIYLLELTSDITNVISTEQGIITLYMPYPPENSWQRISELTETTPEPVIENYLNTIVYQIPVKNGITQKTAVKAVYKVHVWSVETSIPAKAAKQANSPSDYYAAYTRADNLVPSADEAVISLASEIVGKEKGTYNRAKLIYDYLTEELQLLNGTRPAESSVLDAISTKQADSYDMAIMFAALCRSLEIPAIPVSGVLVHDNLTTENHWWNEFYLDSVGWIPVDPGLGAGKAFDSVPEEEAQAWYFGNLDAQHIAFSRGFNTIKSAQQSGKKVYRPKTFALQSVWEEASADTTSYSSYWSPVIVQGVY